MKNNFLTTDRTDYTNGSAGKAWGTVRTVRSLKKNMLCALCLLCALCVSSCDSGDIEDQRYSVSDGGKVVKLTARVSGIGTWNEGGYSVALAGFSKDENYATMQRTLPASMEDDTEVTLTLSNITDQVETVEFAITNNLRKRIITLESINMADYEGDRDTIRMDVGTIDVSMFGVLQHGLFNVACIQCHGGNGRSAAGLDLTEGHALPNLVDVPSTRREDMLRIVSGSPEQSLLRQLLNEGGEDILTYNHTEVVSSQFKNNKDEVLSLLDEWINTLIK